MAKFLLLLAAAALSFSAATAWSPHGKVCNNEIDIANQAPVLCPGDGNRLKTVKWFCANDLQSPGANRGVCVCLEINPPGRCHGSECAAVAASHVPRMLWRGNGRYCHRFEAKVPEETGRDRKPMELPILEDPARPISGDPIDAILAPQEIVLAPLERELDKIEKESKVVINNFPAPTL